ncbi:hypothetical protein [Thiorhodovibrio winogradskyi]|uniref:hypothetical protein n=1 Tax=Thiorhodovibrio winogradskyi TaxID=77007 RepID=UPI002E28495E|nr:hypothetical protein [Thiorhodovibrio winogradskyi]
MPIGALGGLLKALWSSAVQASSRALTAHLRDCFCDFQRDYANYAFYCAQAHRDFKEALHAGDQMAARACYGRLVTAVEDGLAPMCVDHAQMV